jgi:myo-inositol-1(or 4)-monophosphatase
MTNTEVRADLAARAANAGAQVALESFRGNLTVETKSGKTDLVTQTDRAAQRRVVEIIREKFPNDAIVGEEEDALKEVPESGPAWIIDPIDGTSNFVRGLRVWGTSVAAVEDGESVAAATVLPALSDTYLAGADGVTLNGDPVAVSTREDPETFAVAPTHIEYDRPEQYATLLGELATRFGDIRRFGSSQATLAAVAGGSLEAAVTNVRMSPWDTVGGAHMIRQAGGTVTDLAGEPWRHDSQGLVASNGVAHEAVLMALRNATNG